MRNACLATAKRAHQLHNTFPETEGLQEELDSRGWQAQYRELPLRTLPGDGVTQSMEARWPELSTKKQL